MKITLSLFITYIAICFQTLGQNTVVSSNLNLRNSPSLEGQVITIIPKSSNVNITECSNGWCYVSFSSYEGFVRKSYLKNSKVSKQNDGYSTNTQKYYRNYEGIKVQSPTYYNAQPSGATAECRDGTYSFSRSRRGTCSHHGGVKRWL